MAPRAIERPFRRRFHHDQPTVRTTWHWLLNNRDGDLDLRTFRPDGW